MGDCIVARHEGLLVAEVHDELLGLHSDAGTCYGFNRTAAWIWKAIERPKGLAELCRDLVDEYEVDERVCEVEVRNIIREFEGEGLVKVTRVAEALD